jgi:hypothetical protein
MWDFNSLVNRKGTALVLPGSGFFPASLITIGESDNPSRVIR